MAPRLVLAVLVAVDRMVLPFARALVGEPARKAETTGDVAPGA